MKLKEYISEIRKTVKAEKFKKLNGSLPVITERLGIYDNYPILLQTDYARISKHLEDSREFIFEKETLHHENLIKKFRTSCKSIEIKVHSWIPEIFCTNGLFSSQSEKQDLEIATHRKRQQEEFNTGISLHWPDNSYNGSIEPYIRMAEVVMNLGRYAIANKTPICLPLSAGWDTPGDTTKIVYFYPAKNYSSST